MNTFRFPLARITIGFVIGILWAYYLKPDFLMLVGLLLVSLAFIGLLNILSVKLPKAKIFSDITIYLIAIFIGAIIQTTHNGYFNKNNYIHQCIVASEVHDIELRLDEKLKSTVANERYFATINRFDGKESSGKILVNIKKSDKKLPFEIGSNLKVTTQVNKPWPPNNPDQFDYGKYLENKSVLAQLSVEGSEIAVGKTSRTIQYYAAKLRNRIIRNLEKSNFSQDELHVIVALILGQQQEISADILHDYQFAGAVHVLSVSGLHVGFLLLFINTLLSRFPKNKKWNLFRFITIAVVLWIFAIIAGLSPSVVRSVTMFTFVAAGMYFKRETNSYHTVLVSMLFILIVAPSFLFDVGFQLSYVSLFFILWLQPLFAKIWAPKNKIITYFWNILTVSFAAQIGALPLSIYYFHQFPGLFFITNLVILPGLGIIMGFGLFVMILALFGYVPKFTAYILEEMIWILNWIINKIASFEAFIITDIPLNFYLLFMCYILILAIFFWFKKPGFQRLLYVFLGILLLQSGIIFTKFQTQSKKEWIVFHARRNTMIVDRIGKSITLYANDSLLKNRCTKRNLDAYLVANFSKLEFQKPLQNVFLFNHKKIIVMDSMSIYPTLSNPDVVLMTQSPKINLSRMLKQHRPELIIVDGSNYRSYVALWEKTCRKEKIPFHVTAEKGFYRLTD